MPPLRRGQYAAHTSKSNSHAIGVSLCCMAGARERPFDAGRFPMTRQQWDRMVEAVAALSRRYRIPVSPRTMLWHAEVQSTLGIPQRGKWDATRLAFDDSVQGSRACGDKLREEVGNALGNAGTRRRDAPVASGTVTASSLRLRRAPDGPIIGSMPRGTTVIIHGAAGPWREVTTPAGARGWAHGDFIRA